MAGTQEHGAAAHRCTTPPRVIHCICHTRLVRPVVLQLGIGNLDRIARHMEILVYLLVGVGLHIRNDLLEVGDEPILPLQGFHLGAILVKKGDSTRLPVCLTGVGSPASDVDIATLVRLHLDLDQTGVGTIGGASRLILIRVNLIRGLLYTSPSPRDRTRSRMPSSA